MKRLILLVSLAGCEKAPGPLRHTPLPPDSAGSTTMPVTPGSDSLAGTDSSESIATLPPARDTSPSSPFASASPSLPPSPAGNDLDALAATLIIPVQGIKSSDLRDTFTESRGSRVHEAIDIPAARGTPVISATAGKVLKLHSSRAGGLMIYAGDAADRFILMYGHLDRYADGVREGMSLQRGQVIGYVGTTGNAPIGTPHLHFAIARGEPSKSWWRGTAVNPYPLLVR